MISYRKWNETSCYKTHCDGSCREVRNPDPKRFTIKNVMYFERRDVTLIEVKYEGVTHFEGNKILVMKGDLRIPLYSMEELDPHFNNDGKLVARFPCTPDGKINACKFCNS